MFKLFKRKTAVVLIFCSAFGASEKVYADCKYPAEFRCCQYKPNRGLIPEDKLDPVKISKVRGTCAGHNSGISFIKSWKKAKAKVDDKVQDLLKNKGRLCLKRLVKRKGSRSLVNPKKTRRWCNNLGGEIVLQKRCNSSSVGVTLTADNRAVCEFAAN